MDVADSVCREDAFSGSSRVFIGTAPDAGVSVEGFGDAAFWKVKGD
jgi:hypothetical protein